MDAIQEEEEEEQKIDDLMANLDYRRSEAGQANKTSGYKKSVNQHPTRRITMIGDQLQDPEQLLFKVQMTREDFTMIIELILIRMVRMLHKDVDKSCFTLRMIFYRNLCGTLDNVASFLS